MKNFKLLLLLFFMSSIIYSQDYMDDITSKSCECIKNVSPDLKKQKKNMEMGLCLLNAASPYEKEIKRDYGIDFSKIDSSECEKLGRIIGVKLAVSCPEFMELISDQIEEEAENTEESEVENSYIGTVTNINDDTFVEISLTNTEGKTLKFYWLTFVSTEFNLAENYNSLMSKTIKIDFEVQELFDSRISEYRAFNIIKRVNILE